MTLTLGDCVDCLTAFLASGPQAEDEETVDDLTNRLHLALRDQSGCFAKPRGAWASLDISRVLWQPTAATTPEPFPLEMQDAFRALATIAFAIPDVGIPLSAALGVGETLLDRLAEHARGHPRGTAVSDLERLESNLKTFIEEEELRDQFSGVFAQARRLDDLLRDMLVDPIEVTTAARRGFDPTWVKEWNTKQTVLSDSSGLGQVWLLVSDPAFKILVEQDYLDSQLEPVEHRFGLLESPPAGLCTIMAYCHVVQTIVNSLIVYSLVCLMPEEALKPGWNPDDFDMMAAVKSRQWQRVPRGATHCAYDCWYLLRRQLDPASKSEDWITRAHPDKGDGRKAFALIKHRLDRITLGQGVPPNRDGRWYLAKNTSVSHEIPDEIGIDTKTGAISEPFHINDIFRSDCEASGYQSEVNDSALAEHPSDDFAEPYRGFKRELSITWTIHQDVANVIWDIITIGTKAAVEGIEVGILDANYGKYATPWDGNGTQAATPGTYPQLCWYPAESVGDPQGDLAFMDTEIGRAIVAWMAFVILHYAHAMSYEIDVDGDVSTSTYELTDLFYKGWLAVQTTADRFLTEGLEGSS